jgi:uncharacterized protein (TIGR03437 family)
VLYAVGADYVFKSLDFGTTWSQIASQKTTGNAAISKLYIDPAHSQILYGVSSPSNCGPPNGFVCGLLKSSDSGKSWAQLSGLASNSITSVAIDPSSGAIYAAGEVTGIGLAALKSTDGGGTWTPLYNHFNSAENNTVLLAVDPNAFSTVYALPWQSEDMYKSADSGASWAFVQFSRGCDPYVVECGVVFFAYNFVVAPAAATPPPPPSIATNGIVNGASFQPGIVPNSWVTIGGANLASKIDNWVNAIINGEFPTVLDGVSVSIGGKPAYINFISPGQINLVAPDVGFGPLPVTVTTAGGTSDTFMVMSSEYGPAFFQWPNSQPIATRLDYSFAVKNGTFAGVTNIPAKPGEVIVLWGTGFGPTNPIATPGEPVPGSSTYSTTLLPNVSIDNIPAKVYGAALTAGFAGLYQVAIQIPDSIQDGDWPIQASIGGATSPTGILITIQQ